MSKSFILYHSQKISLKSDFNRDLKFKCYNFNYWKLFLEYDNSSNDKDFVEFDNLKSILVGSILYKGKSGNNALKFF